MTMFWKFGNIGNNKQQLSRKYTYLPLYGVLVLHAYHTTIDACAVGIRDDEVMRVLSCSIPRNMAFAR